MLFDHHYTCSKLNNFMLVAKNAKVSFATRYIKFFLALLESDSKSKRPILGLNLRQYEAKISKTFKTARLNPKFVGFYIKKKVNVKYNTVHEPLSSNAKNKNK